MPKRFLSGSVLGRLPGLRLFMSVFNTIKAFKHLINTFAISDFTYMDQCYVRDERRTLHAAFLSCAESRIKLFLLSLNWPLKLLSENQFKMRSMSMFIGFWVLSMSSSSAYKNT